MVFRELVVKQQQNIKCGQHSLCFLLCNLLEIPRVFKFKYFKESAIEFFDATKNFEGSTPTRKPSIKERIN